MTLAHSTLATTRQAPDLPPTTPHRVYPGLLPAVAVAHVVHGYLARQPAYLKSAARLLQQQPESPDMLAVRAVCAMLLGDTQEAERLLRRAAGPAGPAAAQKAGAAAAATAPRDDGSLPSAAQAYAFVERASAAGDEGLLPGLCLFTERWLAKVGCSGREGVGRTCCGSRG